MKKALLLGAVLALSPCGFAKDPEVVVKTSHGDISLRLFADQAPITVENFLAYADSGHYRNTIFHRVIPRFVIQGGGFDARMRMKPTRDPIENEARNRLHNERGTIAMARTNDPNSATAQFFINLRDNFNLDWSPTNHGYAVFGKVIDGMHVVDSIALEQTGSSSAGLQDVPLQPIVITDIVRLEAE